MTLNIHQNCFWIVIETRLFNKKQILWFDIQTFKQASSCSFVCFFEANPKLCFTIIPLTFNLNASTICKDPSLLLFIIAFRSNVRMGICIHRQRPFFADIRNNNTSCPQYKIYLLFVMYDALWEMCIIYINVISSKNPYSSCLTSY
jgi:hypothetical protein